VKTRRFRKHDGEWQYVEISQATGRPLRILCRAERKDWCEMQAKGYEAAEAHNRRAIEQARGITPPCVELRPEHLKMDGVHVM